MLSIYERLKIILDTQGIGIPTDFSGSNGIFLYNFLTEEGGLSLYWSTLSEPLIRHQLLSDDVYSFGGKLSPDKKWILVGIDYDGTEKHHLCRLERRTSVFPAKDLEGLEFANVLPHRIMDFEWSPDGSYLLFAGAEQQKFSLNRISNDLTAYPDPILTDLPGIFWIEWSHLNFACAFGSREPGFKSGLIFIINPVSKEILAEVPNLLSFEFHSRWHPEKPILPILRPEGEHGKMALFHADSKEIEDILHPEGEITNCVWDSDGESLFLGATKDGRSKIYSLNLKEDALKEVPVPVGLNLPLEVHNWQGSATMFYLHGNARSRHDLWMHNLDNKSNTRLTICQSPMLGTEEFPLVPSQSIHFLSSFDEMSIHGFVIVPSAPPPPGGYPCIVYAHGGPMNQYRDEFIGMFQILAQEGFIVFLPNFRGSTGYGEAFLKANFQEAGKADLQDVSSGVDHLIENFNVNPKRVGISGRSYGGYMTLAALAFQPERWASGWASVPIANWEYLYDHGDALFKEFIEYMWGDPEKNRSLMRERSPISKVSNIKAPLGIIQAANDTRTPMPPVLEFAKKLYDRNHPLELHIQPSVGHATIAKGILMRDMAMTIQFFQRTLMSED